MTLLVMILLTALECAVWGAPNTRCDTTASSQTVSLVHVTDLHEQYHPRPDGVSPYARIRGYFETVRDENPNSLLVNGGDDHEKGSLAGTLSRGQSAREATRAMRFDVRVIGNHDFAWGEQSALDHSRDPSGPVLASNLYRVRTSSEPGPVDYARLDVGCVRLGFIGLVGRPWNELDEPYNGDFPGFRVDHDYAAVARRLAAQHSSEVDLLVHLSHLGRATDLLLAANVPQIGLVLGGHSHGLTWEPVRSGRALVLESGTYAQHITRIDLTFNLTTRKLVSVKHGVLTVDEDLPSDAGTQKEMLNILKRHAPADKRRAGCACAEATLSSAAATAAQAAREALGADAALVDQKTVWTPWKAGPLALQDFLDAFKVERQPPDSPGFNSLYLVEISGSELKRLTSKIDPTRWSFNGPIKPEPKRLYRLALTRRAAFHPEDFFPGTKFKRLREGGEVWEVLANWSRRRSEKSLCIDDGCPWPAPPQN